MLREEAEIVLNKTAAQEWPRSANVVATMLLTEVGRGQLNAVKDLSKSQWKPAPEMLQSQLLVTA